jgi:site-specific DNA-cytosine methylase
VSFVANNQANAAIRNADEPAPTITGGHDTAERQWVARFGNQEHSAERALDEPAATLRYGQRANACDWVQTNNFTAVARDSDGKRSKAGSVPYVRPTDEPSPTVTSRTDLWQVGRDPENVVLDRRQTHGDGTPVGPRAATDPAPTMSAQGLAKGRDVWRESSEDPDAYWNRDDLSERKRTAAGTWPHEQPAPTVVGGRRSKDGMIVGRQLPPGEDQSRGGWSDVPADDSRRISEPGHHDEKVSGSQQKNAVRVSVMEAAILQSFPPWPWQGSKTAVYQQIGNAIPPLMARRVIRAARGVPQATP